MKWTLVRKWASVLFVLLFGLAGARIIVWDSSGALLAYQQSKNPVLNPAGPQISVADAAAAQREIDALRSALESQSKELDLQEKRIDALRSRSADVQLLLTILLGIGTLYAVAQAIFSYLNVDSFTKKAENAIAGMKLQAEEEVSKMKVQWDEFQRDCRREFPRFVGMEKIMESVFSELVVILRSHISQNAFEKVPPSEQQKVYFHEKSLAGLEYLDIQVSLVDLFTVFRGLGLFYAGKYEYEKRSFDDKKSLIAAAPADLERGKFYLSMALKKAPNDFRIKNDQSRIAEILDNDKDKAAKLSAESLAANPKQQRALYNLGTLFHNGERYQEAIDKFEDALKQTDWEDRPNKKNTGSLYFNLACSRCKLYEKKGLTIMPPDEERRVVSALKDAITHDHDLISDIAKDPDLNIFRSNPNNVLVLDGLLKA